MFVLFIPKLTRLKNPDEIKKRHTNFLFFTVVNVQLFDNNRPKTPYIISLLSYVFNT